MKTKTFATYRLYATHQEVFSSLAAKPKALSSSSRILSRPLQPGPGRLSEQGSKHMVFLTFPSQRTPRRPASWTSRSPSVSFLLCTKGHQAMLCIVMFCLDQAEPFRFPRKNGRTARLVTDLILQMSFYAFILYSPLDIWTTSCWPNPSAISDCSGANVFQTQVF